MKQRAMVKSKMASLPHMQNKKQRAMVKSQNGIITAYAKQETMSDG